MAQTTDLITPTNVELEGIQRMSMDIARSARTLSAGEARFLVDTYYSTQKARQRAENQVSALTKSGEPHSVLNWWAYNSRTMEDQVKRALDKYSSEDPLGAWARSITGIGPVIAAGLLAHIDMNKAPTCGHIHSFAGLNPNVSWHASAKIDALIKQGEKGESLVDLIHRVGTAIGRKPENLIRLAQSKDEDGNLKKAHVLWALKTRPHNAGLKTLCWKIGESFVKVSGNPNSTFGRIYRERKELETERNAQGAFAEQAEHKLTTTNIGKATEAYGHYSAGHLPPAHIHERSKRVAVKLFLSCLHAAGCHLVLGREAPVPYIIAHDPGHTHQIDWKEVS